jgi:hypothetical protein
MATGTINFYTKFKQRLLNKEIDFDSDTFLVALLQSGYTPGADHSVTTQLTNEVAAGGYARATLGSLALAQTGSAIAWSAANVVWTASGAAFTAHYWVLIDDTPTGDCLVAYGLIDNSPASVTVSDGNTLTLSWNANGILKLD